MTRRFCNWKCTQRNIVKHNVVRPISRWTIRQSKSGAQWEVNFEYNEKKKFLKLKLSIEALHTIYTTTLA